MNERLQQLVKQFAEDFTARSGYDMREFEPFIKESEKFAELIVRECSAFVYNYPEKYLTRNQAREICLGTEEHFGVES